MKSSNFRGQVLSCKPTIIFVTMLMIMGCIMQSCKRYTQFKEGASIHGINIGSGYEDVNHKIDSLSRLRNLAVRHMMTEDQMKNYYNTYRNESESCGYTDLDNGEVLTITYHVNMIAGDEFTDSEWRPFIEKIELRNKYGVDRKDYFISSQILNEIKRSDDKTYYGYSAKESECGVSIVNKRITGEKNSSRK